MIEMMDGMRRFRYKENTLSLYRVYFKYVL